MKLDPITQYIVEKDIVHTVYGLHQKVQELRDRQRQSFREKVKSKCGKYKTYLEQVGCVQELKIRDYIDVELFIHNNVNQCKHDTVSGPQKCEESFKKLELDFAKKRMKLQAKEEKTKKAIKEKNSKRK